MFTITTVQRAACETRFGTLPSRNSVRPPMPALPTTSTSALSSSAARTMPAAGSGSTRTTARARAVELLRVPGEQLLGALGRLGEHLEQDELGAHPAGQIRRPRDRVARRLGAVGRNDDLHAASVLGLPQSEQGGLRWHWHVS